MSTVVAIELTSEDFLTVVAAERGREAPLALTQVLRVPLDKFTSTLPAQANVDDEQPLDEQPAENAAIRNLLEELGIEADATLVVLPGENVLYRTISLPFDQPKKVEQATPLQIQDFVPFDIDTFVLDHMLVGKTKEGGEFEILTSLIPQEEIADALESLGRLGLDPKFLSTRASALATLGPLLPEHASQSYALLALSRESASIAIFVQGKLKLLREKARDNSEQGANGKLGERLTADIQCTIAKIESDYSETIDRIYFIGQSSDLHLCELSLARRVEAYPLMGLVEPRTAEQIPLENVCWSLGLLSRELQGGKAVQTDIVDFRKGSFAYKPVLKKVLAALQQELFKILLCVTFLFGWIGSTMYRTTHSLAIIDQRISEILRQSIPGESITYRREVMEVENRVAELEEQLRGIGSLATLSPLESLKELSGIIGSDIGIEIDALNIGPAGISFRGSVADTPSVGRLSGSLEKRSEMFCSVKVDPKGRVPNSARVNYSADIELCE